MDVSLGGWRFGGFMGCYVGRRLVVGWMCGWMCRNVGSVWMDLWMDVSVCG